MSYITDQFIDYIYQISQITLPDHILQCAKNSLLDYLAVSFGGSVINKDVNASYYDSRRPEGNFHVIGSERHFDLNDAVLINAFNAHTLELDDGHRVAMTHLEAPIFSALLGVAELEGCTIDEVYHAAVIGYEVTVRLGTAIQPSHKKKGFHVTGTCGTVGCALAVAAMLGYSRQEMLNTLSAAATSGAGLLEVITGKSEQKPYNVANAAVSGVNAALYGKYYNGPADILGGERGFMRNFSTDYDESKLIQPNGVYAIEGSYMKPYAACRHCHAPMEATLTLRKLCDVPADKIESILVETYDLAVYGHDHKIIHGTNSAKMSIPFCVSVAYLKQQCGMEVFTRDVLCDTDVLNLAEKVQVKENPVLSALVPEKRVAIVTIYTNDGKKAMERVDYPKGEPENPITKEELIAKFYSMACFAGKNITECKSIIDFVYSSETEAASQLFSYV